MNPTPPVLIAGGYGVVGAQIARLLRERHPDLPLTLAGRTPAKAAALVTELGRAEAVALDVSSPAPLDALAETPRAVIAAVNDPDDFLLLDTVHRGIPYLDITRWTERLRSAVMRTVIARPTAPVIFASSWMAGVAALMAKRACAAFHQTHRIDISVLYSTRDKAGPDSVEYMDRLNLPYPITVDGRQIVAHPFTDPKTVAFPGNFTGKVYRFDTPDQITLPLTTGASTVIARIGFDRPSDTAMLVGLVRSGVWNRISGDRFTRLRRKLMYNPGEGGPHEILVEATGTNADETECRSVVTLSDPLGQTHLTALGATLQLERILGLDGKPAPEESILFPDTAPNLPHAFESLQRHGVAVHVHEHTPQGHCAHASA